MRIKYVLAFLSAALLITSCGGGAPSDPYARYIDPGLSSSDQQTMRDTVDILLQDEKDANIIINDVDTASVIANRSADRGAYALNERSYPETIRYASLPSSIAAQDVVQYPTCNFAPFLSKSGPYYRVYSPEGAYTLVEQTVVVPKATVTEIKVAAGTADTPHVYLGGWGQSPTYTGIDAGLTYERAGVLGQSGVWKPIMRVTRYNKAQSDYVYPGAQLREVLQIGFSSFQVYPGEKVLMRFRIAPMSNGDYNAILYMTVKDTSRKVVLALRKKPSSSGTWLNDWHPTRNRMTLKRMVTIAQSENEPVTPNHAYVARNQNDELFNLRVVSSGWGGYSSSSRAAEDGTFTKCRSPGVVAQGKSTQPVNVSKDWIDYDNIPYKELVAIYPWNYADFSR